MSIIIEDGTGVSGANAYTTAAEVTTYLTARNRETENSWSTSSTAIKEGAGERIIAANKANKMESLALARVLWPGAERQFAEWGDGPAEAALIAEQHARRNSVAQQEFLK